MKHKLLFSWFSVMVCCLWAGNVVWGQCMLVEVPLEKQVAKSSLVVEGKVVAKESVWNTEKNRIFTVNTVEVYKIFKGKTNANIQVVTLGGTVGDITQTVTPSLSLKEGDVGVFTLYDNNVGLTAKSSSNLKKYKAYSSLQGFYKYDLVNNSAANPFAKRKSISNGLYNQITAITGQPYKELLTYKVNDNHAAKESKSAKALAPSVSGFTPASVTAGNEDVLTISGSGFGTTKGTVEFRNADDAGETFVAALDSQVLSWSDSEILVEVPSKAGTGSIRVSDSAGASAESTGDELFVPYSLRNNVNSGNAVLIQHIGTNGTGMIWNMNVDFDANTPAKEAFIRAFDTWRCETGINWELGGTTPKNTVAIDDTNVVLFDDNDPLDEGVLGLCWTTTGSCGDDRDVVAELDIVFNNDIDDSETGPVESWYFGSGLPAFEQYDFESVALHELGHGHQLEHVINTNDVMHYALSNSETQRFLSGNNETAAGIIQNFSTTTQMCGQTMMEDYSGSCSLGVSTTEVLADQIYIYPSPVNDILYIENRSAVSLDKVILFDIGGRAILNLDMVDAPRVKAINVGEISKGIYFLNLVSGNTVVGKKVVVE